MCIFRDNIICISCNSAIHEFVIIFIHLCQQTKTIIRLPVMGLGMTCDSFHYISSHLRRRMDRKDFFVF